MQLWCFPCWLLKRLLRGFIVKLILLCKDFQGRRQ
ncbi:hypothetical protein GCK32_022616 [Trichostrongylus colubriformis]|uniref:Uncharacterized protein n=1 Tax=Trichostrongylus colubriformis TaxID=6319 RepID=A0AAN8J286_TRICO